MSLRDPEKGSIFINALFKVWESNGAFEIDLLMLLTKVNQQVVTDCNDSKDPKKQIHSLTHTLRKYVILVYPLAPSPSIAAI